MKERLASMQERPIFIEGRLASIKERLMPIKERPQLPLRSD